MMRQYKIVALNLLMVSVLSACVTMSVDDLTHVDQFVIGEGVIGILSNRQHALQETEEDFMTCAINEIAKSKFRIKLMDESSLRDALFPWFEPSIAPSRVEDIVRLTRTPKIAEQFKKLKLRYLIWIDGESVTSNSKGAMSCAVTPAGGGCFGFAMWDNNSNYKATIWDVDGHKSLGTISTKADGTSVMPSLIIPLPLLARTQSSSCHMLGTELKLLLERASS